MATYSYFVKPQAFYTDIASVTPAQPMVFDYADIPVFRFSFLPNAIQAGDTLVFASDDDMIFYADDPGNILHSASCMIINKHVVTEDEAALLKVEMPINTRTIKFRDTVNGKIRPVDVMTALYVLRDTGDDKAYSVLAKGRGLCNAIIADYDSLPEPITTGEYYTKSELDALLAEKAEASALQAHVDDADIHVTLDDKSKWDSKADIQDITDAVDGLATVAKSGSYNDLTDQPEIVSVDKITEAVSAHNASPDAHAQLFEAKQDKIDADHKLPASSVEGLATVATTGSYNDLTDQPTIPTVPTKVSEFENDANYQTKSQLDDAVAPLATTENVNAGLATKQDKIDADHKLPASSVEGLATVATTGSYNDLADQPVIPAAANDAKITITQGGVEKGSFTLNQADPATIEVDAGGADDVNYLTFVAEEAGSTLHLDKVGDAALLTARLQYRLNDGDWIDYNWTDKAGDPITLTNIGDFVQWKAKDQNEQFSNYDSFYKFKATGKIAGSGSIMTLLDETDQLRDLTGKDNCFISLFEVCASLTKAPDLPATTLANSCYRWLFSGCTSLTKAPDLPATTLANSCYRWLFSGCTSLTTAPALPATTLAPYCYASLFNNCTSLTTAPALPATALAPFCYNNTFLNCTSLTKAPDLPATTLAPGCYSLAFNGCTSLTTAPELPATTLANQCYYSLFGGCTSLTTAPELPATTLANQCYYNLFKGCTNLSEITLHASLWGDPNNSGDCFDHWVEGVKATGVFHCCKSLSATTYPDGSRVPVGWEIKKDIYNDIDAHNDAWDAHYNKFASCAQKSAVPNNIDYLTLTPLEVGSTLKLVAVGAPYRATLQCAQQNVRYVTTLGLYWETFINGYTSKTITATDLNYKWRFRGNGSYLSKDGGNYYHFVLTGKWKVSGSILSLVRYELTDYFLDLTHFDSFGNQMFLGLFADNPGVTIDASGLRLPAHTLTNGCYSGLFKNCTGLIKAPELPATTLAPYCYNNTFLNCTSLTKAPDLPATTLANMCYGTMFADCTALTESPYLPDATLADWSYWGMFRNCYALKRIKIGYSGDDNPNAFSDWTLGASGSGTIVCPEGFPSEEVPAGWTRVTSYDDVALDAELKSKADKSELNAKQDKIDDVNKLPAGSVEGLATVATTGSYNDLADLPAIPEAQVQADWNEVSETSKAFIRNKPAIPAIPTNVGEFTNDADYQTGEQVTGTITTAIADKADKSELPVNPVVGSAAGMKLWTGLQSEYDGIQTKDPSTVYVIKEG